jgi:hypothetical protein
MMNGLMRLRPLPAALALLFAGSVLACEGPKKFTTTLEVVQIEPFKEADGGVAKVALELRYADCPGDNRRIIRADKSYASCGAAVKAGDKLKAELVSTWQSDRGAYRSEIVRLGDCPMKQDPKDDANYEMVQTCTDVITTGAVVGVRCDRTRSPALVAKCPWLRRK